MRRVLHAVAASVLAVTVGLAISTPANADQVRTDQWHLSFLDIAKAHAISQGEGITVAVVDSGIDNNHPDLVGNVLPGLDVVVGGAGNGWGDELGHGTGMAGLIAAHGHGSGNANGALGIAPKAKILPIRINTGAGYGDGTALAVGVDDAVKRGAKIITVPINSTVQSYDAVQRAIKAGVIVVASSGNRPRENFIGDPAAHPGVVAVGRSAKTATSPTFRFAARRWRSFARRRHRQRQQRPRLPAGHRHPPVDRHRLGRGRSGLVEVSKSTSTQVVEHLTKTAADKGAPGRDSEYGFGVVDIVKALTTEPSTAPTASPIQSLQTAPIVAPSEPEPKSNLVWWGAIGDASH